MNFLSYDFGVYPNFFLVVFKSDDGKKITIRSDMDEEKYKFYLGRLKFKVESDKKLIFYGANNDRYDTVMLNYLLCYYDRHSIETIIQTMYNMSKSIIVDKEYHMGVMAQNGIARITQEMDVFNFLNAGANLKEIGCRLHHPILEGLPYPPHEPVFGEQRNHLERYCENDVDIVILIRKELVSTDSETILNLIDYFGLDMSYCSETLGGVVEAGLVNESMKPNPPQKFRYKSPVNFNFKTDAFKDILATYEGLILEPKSNFDLEVKIGNMDCVFALGGAHGAVKQSKYENIIDFDAKAYYPCLMETFNFLPNTLRSPELFYKMIDDKERLSQENDPREKSVKLGINIVFGRTGYEGSKLYSPDNKYQITITGQLLLLRLIEDLVEAGYEPIYLNTDGLSVLDNGSDEYKEVIEKWQGEFGLTIKTVFFRRAFYRDVNNFIAEDKDGNIKRKGDFSTESSKKRSCFGKIAVDAVVEHLLHDCPIRDYVNAGKDLRSFLMYHKYNSDIAVFMLEDGKTKRLPNVVRYYLAQGVENAIVHRKKDKDTLENRSWNENVKLIPTFYEKDGIVPLPEDLDKEAYVQMAYDLLEKFSGQEVEENPYVESLLETIEGLM